MQTFRREHDRFWILAAHPENNLFAAGHDNGLIVFKLARERPAYTVHKGMLYYVKERYLRCYSFASGRDVPLMTIRRSKGTIGNSERRLSYNPVERSMLICSDADGGKYDLYQIPTEKRKESAAPKRGVGAYAEFVARNRYVVLSSGHLVLHNLSKEATNKIPAPAGTDRIFTAGPSRLLLRCDGKILLFDVQQRRAVAEVPALNIKYTFWSPDKEFVALMGKDVLIITTKKLVLLCSIHETIRLKSGAWNDDNVFVYTTLNHIKYCLTNGDHGVIRTLETPVYVTGIHKNKVFCLDREAKNRVIRIDTTEFKFKIALLHKRYHEIIRMAKPGSTNIVGQSIIAYLQRKGFPEVALNFVKDETTRFNLALECGDIETAISAAKALDDTESWHRLGVEALRQGNHQVVEVAYQRTKNFERLSFLYLITGNNAKLQKMLKISEMRNDVMGRFHNALYLGDVEDRVRVLTESGQTALAYATAKTHGLTEAAENLEKLLDGNVPVLPSETELLFPLTPVVRLEEWNWPLLSVSARWPPAGADMSALAADEEVADASGDTPTWPEDDDKPLFPDEGENIGLADDAEGADIFGADDGDGENLWDIGLAEEEGLNEIDMGAANTTGSKFYVPPTSGPSFTTSWTANSDLAAHHVAAGSVSFAMELLNKQAGIVNFAPLKDIFLSLFMSSRAPLTGISSAPSLITPVETNEGKLPASPLNLQALIQTLQSAYSATTKGAFPEALKLFVGILHKLLLVIVDGRKANKEAMDLLSICREYITGIRMELHKKTLRGKPLEQTTLSAYFTHCQLQPIHRMLSLRSAMKSSYRIKNYKLASSFARRLLEVASKQDVVVEARKVIKFAENNAVDQHDLNYDDRNPFVLCCISFTPIYKNQPQANCPYCASAYLPLHSGSLCPNCNLAEIGKEVSGLKLFQSRKH
eukprot:TRINITY_DN906_c0_g1_i2.p1 TRINITY_DN906_c0_g1~~TRINITY_DN906_c0_g1_i2.p1  ORF type:complete len:930 (-),score=161.09 TRINITY_DN906_c0_g1_i2:177-2966(-)